MQLTILQLRQLIAEAIGVEWTIQLDAPDVNDDLTKYAKKAGIHVKKAKGDNGLVWKFTGPETSLKKLILDLYDDQKKADLFWNKVAKPVRTRNVIPQRFKVPWSRRRR